MKRNNAKRVLALVLASAMLMQQSWVGTLAAETETVTEAQTEKLTEAPATEAPAPETKAEETQAPATEAPAPETKPEETQAPATEAPTEGEETGETQTPETEAPGETATEAPTEAQTEAVTEAVTEAATEAVTEKESETEEEAVLDTAIKQEVFQKTVEDDVQPMIKYTIKLTNKAKTADAEGVSVKVLLAKDLSYTKEEGETAELGVYGKLDDAVNADVFKNIELDDVAKTAYAEGSVALWQDQKIAAGEEKEFVFFAAVEDGVADTEALRNLWFVNDEAVANDKLQWQNAELLKVEKELPTEFTCEYGNMVVTATLSDGAILPEGAQFVVTEKTLSEEETALIEESLGGEQTMTGYVAYDMHFEVDGAEVEPEGGAVSVSVSYNKAQELTPVNEDEDAVPKTAEIQVLHITDDQTVEDIAGEVDAKKNGKLREVGFTTDGFSTFVFPAVRPIAENENQIFIKDVKVGTRTFHDLDKGTATGMFNGGANTNSATNRYVVYVGETLDIYANLPSIYKTAKFEQSSDCISGGNTPNTNREASYVAIKPGNCDLVLKLPNAKWEINTLYIEVRYPIYVKTHIGEFHKDTIHEFLDLIGWYGDSAYVTDPNSNKLYLKNTDATNGDGTYRARYLMYAGDTVELSTYSQDPDARFSNPGNVTMDQTVSGPDENGLYKITAKITINSDIDPSIKALDVSFGGEKFYIEVRPSENAANHFDIEIADGGTYTVVNTVKNSDGTQITTRTVYDVYVNGINQCDVFWTDGSTVLESGEYWRHGEPGGTTQYELTSAYQTDGNGNPKRGDDEGLLVAYRDIPRDKLTSVIFDLKLRMIAKERTETIVEANGNSTTKSIAAESIPQNERVIDEDSVKVEMGKQQILDAGNKCPIHNGLDFTLVINEFISQLNEPEKKETKPGDGVMVKIGQEITYTIDWKNFKDGKADVTIEDPLDIGVDFVSADNGGKYDASARKVTWLLKDCAAGAEGKVTLTVRVNKNAFQTWQYGPADVPTADASTKDYEVVNRASVQVDNYAKVYTNVVENPVPEKEETDPGAGKTVAIGKAVTYRIHWKNGYDASATVTVKDSLDPGVDFVSADNGGKYDASAHTVTWTLEEQTAGAEGDVVLTVRVNKNAKLTWNYETGAGEGEDGKILNQASVQVNDDPEVFTDIIPNPVDEGPKKTEKAPGDGKMVQVGDVIVYQIDWVNYQDEAANVVITDKLDPGVDFASASDGGMETGGIVTWTLKDQPAGAKGSVTVTVTVNKKAFADYTYVKEPGQGDDAFEGGTGKDHDVWNRAGVQVGDDPKVYTNIVENPLPEKEETDPGADKTVPLGKEITYKIHWKNGHEETANVTITDKLDPGVDFVSADNGGSYNKETHTVTWILKDQAGGAEGAVELKVKVNENAKLTWNYGTGAGEGEDGRILNQAGVQVGNDKEVKTEIIPNPVDEGPHKTETKPGDGVMVGIDEEIEYRITWKNYQDVAATVVITDALDPGVGFVSATDGGVYDKAAHTVTWTLKDRAANAEGFVTFRVKVNTDAFLTYDYVDGEDRLAPGAGKDYEVVNRASVKVGNDPKVITEKVENPVPEKTETIPGGKQTVGIGQEITYNIHWSNGHDADATVTVTDRLDPGVDFASASDGGEYDEATHTVTWELGTKHAKDEGTLELKVRVNEGAEKAWDYTNGSGGGKDNQILNQAGVKVGNDSEVKTEIIPNPVDDKPHKTEPTPGNGVMVDIGEEITYEITWKNYQGAAADVVITDALDPGSDYVNGSASDGGDYNKDNHVLTWTLRNQPAGAFGKVSFKVKVNEKAYAANEYKENDDKLESKDGKDYEVVNRASVKVGNDAKVFTEMMENPVPEKTEETPGADKIVVVGQEITYKIHWTNGHNEPATVTVTDRLDPGVDFVSADNGGSYNEKTHTVTWNLGRKEKEAEGFVELKVKVNEKAFENWQYAEKSGVPEDKGGKDLQVLNRAGVKVGNDSEVLTKIIPNPVDEGPKKTEPKPGYGKKVKVGDEITYEITWKNYKDTEAVVTVTDQLDAGVEFVRSTPDKTGQDGQMVTWNLGKKAKGESGKVTLVVKVKEEAFDDWHYGEADEPVIKPGEKDSEVVNRAGVQIDNDPKVYTETMQNPLDEEPGKPKKEEVTPGDKLPVKVGDHITYKVSFRNYKGDKADVTVTDKLNAGLTFVKFREMSPDTPAEGYPKNADGTLTWVVKDVPAYTEGYVTFEAEVNEKALTPGKVENQAGVQVGDDPKVDTEIVENPVSEPKKTETAPGNGMMVGIGDTLTYEITWKNYKDTEAEVVIIDKLDPGVAFAEASDGGTAEGDVVTWNLGKKAANASGKVTLTVTVTEKAFEGWKYVDKPGQEEDKFESVDGKDYEVWNRAAVKIGNDPKVYTNIVENPVPDKEEIDPGANETVYVGDQIAYEIYWKNGHDTTADVTVTDPLDEGLDFVSADQGGTYDSAARTVTWVIKNAAAGQSGKVTLVAKVNMNARKDDHIVENQAGVQVGNDPKVLTKIIPNPTPEEPRDGSISVTKKLTSLGEDIYAINETFYVALFSDEACRKRVTEIKAVEFKNASSSTVTFKELDIGRTYYVGEVNANGEVILTGQVKDGTLFVADFNKGKSAVIEKSGDSKTIVFENTFQTIPDSFYRSGRLNITKKLLGADGEALNRDETFYAGIFEDAGHTRLSDKVSENIVELNLAGGSSVSKIVSVVCDPKGPTTLYVTEVTSDGKPVGRSFGYAVTVDKEKVSLDMQNMTADVTITNQELEETESEFESESESESETVKPTEKSVKTGDNTPIVRYVLLILAALALAVIAAEVRRRRRAEK